MVTTLSALLVYKRMVQTLWTVGTINRKNRETKSISYHPKRISRSWEGWYHPLKKPRSSECLYHPLKNPRSFQETTFTTGTTSSLHQNPEKVIAYICISKKVILQKPNSKLIINIVLNLPFIKRYFCLIVIYFLVKQSIH